MNEMASMAIRISQLENELEEYRLRLAGALTIVEGHKVDIEAPGIMTCIRTCPTIKAVLALRQELERVRTERSLWAFIRAHFYACFFEKRADQ